MTPPSSALPILDNLLALAVQLLIADNPDLLLPPEVTVLRPSRRLAAARAVVALLRETHYALVAYGDESRPRRPRGPAFDDIPF